jgi:hypothetical protein
MKNTKKKLKEVSESIEYLHGKIIEKMKEINDPLLEQTIVDRFYYKKSKRF